MSEEAARDDEAPESKHGRPADAATQNPTRAGRRRAGINRRKALQLSGFAAAAAAAGAGIHAAVAESPVAATPRQHFVPSAPELSIKNVTVLDPLDGSIRADVTVHVRDGHILDVTNRPPPASPDMLSVDGRGKFVVPGYNNMHTHALIAERPELVMACMLAEGVTGFRQMSGSADLLAARAAKYLPLGVHAPNLLAMPGELLLPFNAGSVSDATGEIRRQKDADADFIKIILTEPDVFFASLGEAARQGLPTAGHLPPGVYHAEAAQAGYRCIEHMGAGATIWTELSGRSEELKARIGSGFPLPGWVFGLPFAKQIITKSMDAQLGNPMAGMDSDARALMQLALDSFDADRSDALAQTFVSCATWQVPTLVRLRTQELAALPEYQSDPWIPYLTDDARRSWRSSLEHFSALDPEFHATFRESYAMRLRVVGAWNRAGVPMMAGTDGRGEVPGLSLQQEFGELARAGIAPLDVLRMATTNPARFLGRSETMGRVAAGMEANFVLLHGDPRVGVQQMGRIAAVVHDGHFLSQDDLQSVIGNLAAMPPNRKDGGRSCCG